MNQSKIKINDLRLLPIGRVLRREKNGKKMIKVRIVRPLILKECDICGKELIEKAIKHEGKGSVTYLTECFTCYLKNIEGW